MYGTEVGLDIMNYTKKEILAKVALFEERLTVIENSQFHKEEVAELKAEIVDLQQMVKIIIQALANEQA